MPALPFYGDFSSNPSIKYEEDVPSDTVDLAYMCRSIYVGGTGNVAAVRADDVVVNFLAVPAGTTLHICARRINATGTTATGLVVLY